ADLERALEASQDEMPSEEMRGRLIKSWAKHSSSVMQSLEARMRDQAKSLEKKLRDRADKEISDITAILTELQKSILQELDDPEEGEQMSFFDQWSEEEKEQRERDLDALRTRRGKIPAEIEQETEAIRKRFADPRSEE